MHRQYEGNTPSRRLYYKRMNFTNKTSSFNILVPSGTILSRTLVAIYQATDLLCLLVLGGSVWWSALSARSCAHTGGSEGGNNTIITAVRPSLNDIMINTIQ